MLLINFDAIIITSRNMEVILKLRRKKRKKFYIAILREFYRLLHLIFKIGLFMLLTVSEKSSHVHLVLAAKQSYRNLIIYKGCMLHTITYSINILEFIIAISL